VDNLFNILQNNKPEFGKLYVFLNSLDQSRLKEYEFLQMLSKLAMSDYLVFIVSVDSIRAGTIFDESLLNNFNFYCQAADTFQDFDIE
jgi:hypothetical protein